MEWETVIGLEVHVQLLTRSKLFSGAATQYGAEPNTQACAVDLALPGVLPVMNREAARMAAKFGLAIGAQVNPRSVFACVYTNHPVTGPMRGFGMPEMHAGLEQCIDELAREKGIDPVEFPQDQLPEDRKYLGYRQPDASHWIASVSR